jgi:arginine N-succinyltransferase
MTARTDSVRTICEAKDSVIMTLDHDGGTHSLVSTGTLGAFRCAYGDVRQLDTKIVLDPACAKAIEVGEDDMVSHVARA